MKLFGWARALPFNVSSNWNMQGAPGMAETPGNSHEWWCWLEFFLPSLNWNEHAAERTRILLAHCQSRCPLKTSFTAKKPPWNSRSCGSVPPAASGHHISKGCWGRKGEPQSCSTLWVLGGKKTSTPTMWCCSTSSLSCQGLSLAVLELRHALGRTEIGFLKWQVTGNEFSAPQLPLWSTELWCHEQHWNHPQIFHQGC